MKIIVTYEVTGKYFDLDHFKRGPLLTGLDAINDQLEAEGREAQLKIVDVEPRP